MKKLLVLLALLGLATPVAAQNPFSLINFGATPVDTNSGNKSNGTLRVVLATDGTNPTTVFKIDLSGTGANGTAILVTGTGGTFPVTGTVALSNSFLLDATYTGRTPAGASPADGESNTNTALSRRGAFNFIFNGTTWDRLRGAANALNSTGTGIPTAQIVGQFDDVSPTAITENQFGNLRMSANRNLYGTIRDAAGNERGVNVTAGNALTVDGSAVTQPVSLASVPSHAVTNAGTFAVQATLQAGSAVAGKFTTDQTTHGTTDLIAADQTKIGGTTISVNAGAPDAGTQRVMPADGVSECAIVSAASTNATNCKAGAGNFVGLELYNTTTTVYYLRLYNTVGAPTCSSATGFIRSIPVPPAGAAGQVGGAIVPIGAGVAYGTGIAFCLTGGSSSTDNTSAAVGIFGAIKYR